MTVFRTILMIAVSVFFLSSAGRGYTLAAESDDAAASASVDLALQYSYAALRVAYAEYEGAMEACVRTPGSYSQQEIAGLKSQIQLAAIELARTLAGRLPVFEGNDRDYKIAIACEQVAAAEYRTAMAVMPIQPNALFRGQLEQLEFQAKMAALRVKLFKKTMD